MVMGVVGSATPKATAIYELPAPVRPPLLSNVPKMTTNAMPFGDRAMAPRDGRIVMAVSRQHGRTSASAT